MRKNNQESKIESQKKFISHLEKSSTTVRSWPKWKQNVLGPSEPAPQNVSSTSKENK